MKAHVVLAILAFFSIVMLSSCTKENQLDEQAIKHFKEELLKQKAAPGCKIDTVMEGSGYQARITTKAATPITEYYNTSGFTVTYTHTGVGSWEIDIISPDKYYITDYDIRAEATTCSKAKIVQTTFEDATDYENPVNKVYLQTFKNNQLSDDADVWLHMDLYTVVNPKPE
jgi:hypothetical protein